MLNEYKCNRHTPGLQLVYGNSPSDGSCLVFVLLTLTETVAGAVSVVGLGVAAAVTTTAGVGPVAAALSPPVTVAVTVVTVEAVGDTAPLLLLLASTCAVLATVLVDAVSPGTGAAVVVLLSDPAPSVAVAPFAVVVVPSVAPDSDVA